MFRPLALLAVFFVLVISVASAATTTVSVKAGDTLYRIATRHGLTVQQLKALNGLKSNEIHVGQVLRLSSAPRPTPAVTPARRPAPSATISRVAPTTRPTPRPTNQGTYTVKSGDFLGKIARQYGVSVAALQATNHLKTTVLRVGQRLVIPPRGTRGPAGPAPLPPGMELRVVYRYINVSVKDTPASLAARYGVSAEQLRSINRLGSVRHIVPGMKLLVPSRLAVPIPPRPQRQAVTYRQITAHNVPVQIISVDLRHRDVLVAPVLPSQNYAFGIGATVGQLARWSGARAVINGSYFHPHTYAPAGDIVMQGRLLTWGRIPMALAITPDNRATIRASATPVLRRPLDSTWAGMETVIATGPRLLAGGQVVSTYSNVFRDPALFGKAARSAIGLKSNRDLLLVSTRAKLSISEMAHLMAGLGLRDALLLDGGSSAGIAYRGTVLDSVRKVSYGIGVFTGYTGRRYAR